MLWKSRKIEWPVGSSKRVLWSWIKKKSPCNGGSDGKKNLPAMWETSVLSLGLEDALEKGMATHSSILAWRIPWTEEPGGLKSTGLQRVRHDWVTFTHTTVKDRQAEERKRGSHTTHPPSVYISRHPWDHSVKESVKKHSVYAHSKWKLT